MPRSRPSRARRAPGGGRAGFCHLRINGAKVVFVQTEPHVFSVRPVVAGAAGRDDVEIISGVHDGERVVTHGGLLLKALRSTPPIEHGKADLRSGARKPAPYHFAVLVLTGLGLRAMTLLPIDAVPDVTPNVVQVVTDAPGLGPAEVEKFITFPVEIAMRGMPGITEIRSLSRFGLSSVWIYFEEKYDIYFARRLVMERLPAARGNDSQGLRLA